MVMEGQAYAGKRPQRREGPDPSSDRVNQTKSYFDSGIGFGGAK
jgi:hypothetical protein